MPCPSYLNPLPTFLPNPPHPSYLAPRPSKLAMLKTIHTLTFLLSRAPFPHPSPPQAPALTYLVFKMPHGPQVRILTPRSTCPQATSENISKWS